jgi:hypothetical protein
MITAEPNNYYKKADVVTDCSLGNVLFTIAGVIGTAVKNNYAYGFYDWPNQEFFRNPLPKTNGVGFSTFELPKNYKGFDVGFQGFDIPDNVNIQGYFGSKKYFEHCEDLIRHYFEMVDICKPLKDCIVIHYRNYQNPWMYALNEDYYKLALKKLPEKKIIVITDNIAAAYKTIRLKGDYISNTSIIDFYLLAHADYMIASNSTYSWWGAWLSKAQTVVPSRWFDGEFRDCPVDLKEFYPEGWIML